MARKTKKRMLKVIISGPESSGKTTLCNQLSVHFKKPFIKEFSREYINEINRKYTQEDLLEIAKNQYKLEYQINENLIFIDTDLITIKIWSQYKYGGCHKWILSKIKEQREENRFYILCFPDIAWEFDIQRENKENRHELFNIYKKELEKQEHNYMIIKGDRRVEKIIKEISALIMDI